MQQKSIDENDVGLDNIMLSSPYNQVVSRVNAPDLERRQRAEQRVNLLIEAQRILLDEVKRSEYDQQLKAASAEEAAEESAVDEKKDLSR